MILRHVNLQRYPRVFLAVTGLKLPEFAALLDELLPVYTKTEQKPHLGSALKRSVSVPQALGLGTPSSSLCVTNSC